MPIHSDNYKNIYAPATVKTQLLQFILFQVSEDFEIYFPILRIFQLSHQSGSSIFHNLIFIQLFNHPLGIKFFLICCIIFFLIPKDIHLKRSSQGINYIK
jgi:hypothetical protein